MLVRLDARYIDEMMKLQQQCLSNGDIFLPTSREGYLRAFQFKNFCCGYIQDDRLIAFLNCSIPTEKSARNLGRGRVDERELDYVGHMNTLLIDKHSRHHGIGRAMVKAALTEFINHGCRHIYAATSPDNSASIRLLEHMEFQMADVIMLCGEKRYLFYRRLV